MNKLGIAIKITSNGSGEPRIINNGEWASHVADARPLLDRVGGAEGGALVRFLSFTDQGCLLTVVRPIGGRQGDNVSAWIFIPVGIAIPAADVIVAMNEAEAAISASKINTLRLEQLCRREYPMTGEGMSRPATGEGLAYRYYDARALEQILGPNRYQPYYDPYRYTLLLEQGGPLTLDNAEEAADLTSQPIAPVSLLVPPTQEALQRQLGYPARLLLTPDQPFDRPISLKQGSTVKLLLVREGYHPIELPYTKTAPVAWQPFPLKLLDPAKLKWQMPLLLSDFQICDEHKQPIGIDGKDHKITVKVNNLVLKPQQTHWIDEQAARNATVEVASNSLHYQRTTLQADLTQKPVSVTLAYRRENHQTVVVTRDGSEATLEYQEVATGQKGLSPLKAYYYDGYGRLQYDARRVWVLRLQGFVAAATVALLALAVAWLLGARPGKGADTTAQKPIAVEIEPQQDSLPPTATAEDMKPADTEPLPAQPATVGEQQQLPAPGETADAYAQAIDYLDNNTVWKRAEMEQNATLQGLFDDMNEFRLERLIDHWGLELASSASFQKVVEVASKNVRNHWNPATGTHAPYYNKAGDEAIALTNYLNWLDRDQTKAAQQPATVKQPAKTPAKTSAKKTAKQPAKQPAKTPAKTPAATKQQAGSGNKNID